MKDKQKEIMQINEKNQRFSDCYLQTVNPWAISAKLLKDNPDMPIRVAKAMTFSIISNEYTRLVIDEEHKEQQQNVDEVFEIKKISNDIK
ncbi:hypothetical protein [Candidatus Pelagibacter communis]|uniref:hypothetical protein n=1 Tax=Pelagibacter ubique TaxID=198252 RepID=UPI00094C3564|nr:hypothetical protein [Candidatus Pelagibacter ubique]|tara:strand:+ start:1201 stop:1470 length:270 start_codon:yes stop_codon:yes gene_type:complete